jgi:hypothetical protein
VNGVPLLPPAPPTKRRRPWWRRRWGIALVLVVVLTVIGAVASCQSTNDQSAYSTTAVTTTTIATPATTTAPPAITSTTIDEDEATDPNAAGAVPPTVPAPSSDSPACRSDPHANVYHPDRLVVVSPCVTVSGVVDDVRHESDGDYHLNIGLDPAFAGMVNDRNVSGEDGALVAEIVPADQPGCTPGQPPKPATGTYDYGTCTGANELPPPVATHVVLTGPYVLDTAHGWMEVHPVWAITTGGPATPPAGPPPTPPAGPTTTLATPPPTTTPAGGVGDVQPGAFCSPVGAQGIHNDVSYVCSTTDSQGVPYAGERAHWRRS